MTWTFLPSVSCGAPPEVENAHMFGNRREEYPVNSIIRYQCNPGFTQRHPPVVRCKADGQWEKPQVECRDGESLSARLRRDSFCIWGGFQLISFSQKWTPEGKYGRGAGGVQQERAATTKEWKKKKIFYVKRTFEKENSKPNLICWRPQAKKTLQHGNLI